MAISLNVYIIISVTKYVPLAINHTIKDLVRFNNGNVKSGGVSPFQFRSFGDPVDMLYSELITEHFNAVANVYTKFWFQLCSTGSHKSAHIPVPSHQQKVPGHHH